MGSRLPIGPGEGCITFAACEIGYSLLLLRARSTRRAPGFHITLQTVKLLGPHGIGWPGPGVQSVRKVSSHRINEIQLGIASHHSTYR